MGVGVELRRRPGEGEAEASRVDQPQPALGAEVEGEVLVDRHRRPAGRHREAAAHPEVDHQRRAALEVDQQVLGAPPQPDDTAALEAAQGAAVEGLAERRRADLHALDAAADEPRLEAAAEDLDFRQLGHQAPSIAPAVAARAGTPAGTLCRLWQPVVILEDPLRGPVPPSCGHGSGPRSSSPACRSPRRRRAARSAPRSSPTTTIGITTPTARTGPPSRTGAASCTSATATGSSSIDGVGWRLIPVANDSIVRSLAVDPSGTLFVGAVDEVGNLRPDDHGVLTYVSLTGELDAEDRDLGNVWRTYATEDGIYFWSQSRLLRWSEGRFRSWEIASRIVPVHGRRQAVSQPAGRRPDGPRGRRLRAGPRGRAPRRPVDHGHASPSPGSRPRRHPRRPLLHLLPAAPGGREPARPRAAEGYRLSELERFAVEPEALIREHKLYYGLRLPGGAYAFATMTGGLFIVGQEGELVRRFSRSDGLADDSVWSLYVDRQSGLWLTLNRGLARIELGSAVTAIGETAGLEGTVEAIARHAGELYVATNLGVYRLRQDRLEKIHGAGGPYWSLLSVDVGAVDRPAAPRLLIGASFGVHELSDGEVRRLVSRRDAHQLFRSERHPAIVYVGEGAGLGVLRLEGGEWIDHGRLAEVGEVRSIAEDEGRPAVAGNALRRGGPAHRRDGSDAAGDRHGPLRPRRGPAEPQKRQGPSARGAAGLRHLRGALPLRSGDPDLRPERLVGATPGGRQRRHPPAVPGPPRQRLDEPLRWRAGGGVASARRVLRSRRHALEPHCRALDPRGISRARGRRMVRRRRGTVPFRRLPGRAVSRGPRPSPRPPGRGGSGGERPEPAAASFATLIRSVSVVGLAADVPPGPPGGAVLPYASNSLRFEYALPRFDAGERNGYRSRLVGLDGSWSDWTDETYRDFTALREGRYRFEVEGRDVYLRSGGVRLSSSGCCRPGTGACGRTAATPWRWRPGSGGSSPGSCGGCGSGWSSGGSRRPTP